MHRHSPSVIPHVQVTTEIENLEDIVVNISRMLRRTNQFYSTVYHVICQKNEHATAFNKPKWDAFIDDMRSTYELFETYFISVTTEKVRHYLNYSTIVILTVLKAINSKALNTRNSIETSVDDFFFVINSFIMRSVSTLDAQAVRNIVNKVCTITETEYIEKAVRNLSRLIPEGSNEEILQALVNVLLSL